MVSKRTFIQTVQFSSLLPGILTGNASILNGNVLLTLLSKYSKAVFAVSMYFGPPSQAYAQGISQYKQPASATFQKVEYATGQLTPEA